MSQSEDDTRSSSGLAGPTDQRPLTEQEFQLLQRLFGDPFSFPITFKTWLVSYLESSDLSLPISAVNGLSSILGISGVGGGTLGMFPAGLIFPFGGDSAPAGSLLCDGGSYLRSAQNRLFTAIGTRFGSADANSFSVPDLRGRVPAGKGAHGSVTTIGQSEGAALGDRTPLHTHRLAGDNSGNSSAAGDGWIMLTDYGPTAHTLPEAGKPVDAPAFLIVNFIIVS